MRLVRNAGRVLMRSWAVWAGGYLPLAWLAIPEILFAGWGIELSPLLVWVVACLLASLVPLVRVIDQGGID